MWPKMKEGWSNSLSQVYIQLATLGANIIVICELVSRFFKDFVSVTHHEFGEFQVQLFLVGHGRGRSHGLDGPVHDAVGDLGRLIILQAAPAPADPAHQPAGNALHFGLARPRLGRVGSHSRSVEGGWQGGELRGEVGELLGQGGLVEMDIWQGGRYRR